MFLIFVLGAELSAQKILEQSAPKHPAWQQVLPMGTYYQYYFGAGSSTTSLQDAKEQAINSVLSEIVLSGTISANSKVQTFRKKTNKGSIREVTAEVDQTGQTTIIKGLSKEDAYWQIKKTNTGVIYEYWILMRTPKPGFLDMDMTVDQGYGFPPVWRSAIIPGWGQRYKGENRKGAYFLSTTAISASVSVISLFMSDSYSRKALHERDIDNRKFFNKWSDRSYTIGIISGLISSGLYGYNIFDAATAPGAKRYAQTSPGEKRKLFAYYDIQSSQVSLKLSF